MAEDPDGDFGVFEDLLDGQGEGDDGALVVLPGPKIEVTIRGRLDLVASVEEPIPIRVGPVEDPRQEEKQVRPGKLPEELDKAPLALCDGKPLCVLLKALDPVHWPPSTMGS